MGVNTTLTGNVQRMLDITGNVVQRMVLLPEDVQRIHCLNEGGVGWGLGRVKASAPEHPPFTYSLS